MHERRRTIFVDLRNFRNRPTLTISSAYEEYARDYVTLCRRLRTHYAIYVHRGHSEYNLQLIVRIFSLFIKNKNKHTSNPIRKKSKGPVKKIQVIKKKKLNIKLFIHVHSLFLNPYLFIHIICLYVRIGRLFTNSNRIFKWARIYFNMLIRFKVLYYMMCFTLLRLEI